MIRENLGIIDDNFMMILNVNLQEAEKRDDQQSLSKLREIHEIVVGILREQMQPELRFVNDLLSVEDDHEVIAELEKQAPQYGDALLDILDAVQEIVTAQGQTPVMNRIQFIKDEAKKVLN